MPVFVQHLPFALNQTVSLDAHSDHELCNAVAASAAYLKPSLVTPKRPTPVPRIPPARLRPIDVLQTLGLAMLPPRHVQYHLASWHWTLLRYAYVIDSNGSSFPLATNGLVADYRNHHMTALSEALGVGCALSYAREWLQGVAPRAHLYDPIDFDFLLGVGGQALPGGAASIVPTVVSKFQPDYLVVAENVSGEVRLLLVECKGTCGGRTKAVGQLGRAMHQLESISFRQRGPLKVRVDRHAFAATVVRHGGPITLYAVDPDEEGVDWFEPAESYDPSEFPLRRAEGRLVLPDAATVAARAMERIEDRLVAWAGLGDSAESFESLAIDDLPREVSRLGELVGTTSSVRTPDGAIVEVFTGTLVSTLRAAANRDRDALRSERRRLRAAMTGSEEAGRTSAVLSDRDPESEASAMTDEGVALRISVR